MNPEIIQIGGFVIVVGGLVWNFAFTQGRDKQVEENLNRKIDEHIADDGKVEAELKRNMEAVWKWKDEHERDAANMREKYQTQISEVKGAQMVVGEQFKQVLSVLNEIKDQNKETNRRLAVLENVK